MRNHLINELTAIAKKDKDVMLIAGDLGFGVLNEFMETLPDQFINAGICEQNMASVAAGLALEGKKVYVYSIGNFPGIRCLEQVRNDICYHNANVKIIVVGGGFAYGTARNEPSCDRRSVYYAFSAKYDSVFPFGSAGSCGCDP